MSSTSKSSINDRQRRLFGSLQEKLKLSSKEDSDGFKRNPTPGKASEIIQSLNKRNGEMNIKSFESWRNDHSWRSTSHSLKSTGCNPTLDKYKEINRDPVTDLLKTSNKGILERKKNENSKAIVTQGKSILMAEQPSDSSDQIIDSIDTDNSDARIFKKEKDKSNKRKSNLNRSMVTEAVLYSSDQQNRLRRRGIQGSDSGSDMVTDSQDNPDSIFNPSPIVKPVSSSVKEKSTSDTSDQLPPYCKFNPSSLSPERTNTSVISSKFPINCGKLSETVRRLEALSSQESSDVSRRSFDRAPWGSRKKNDIISQKESTPSDDDPPKDSLKSQVLTSGDKPDNNQPKQSKCTKMNSPLIGTNRSIKLENNPEHSSHRIYSRKTSLDSELSRVLGANGKSGAKTKIGFLAEPQGILKRKSSFDYGETDHHGILKNSGSEESDRVESQGILKRRSMSGPDMTDPDPKPILKKLSSCEDLEPSIPRPILKKKMFTDDESEDKPKPILKMKQKSLEDLDSPDTSMRSILKKRPEGSDEKLDSHSDCDKPKSILKFKSFDDISPVLVENEDNHINKSSDHTNTENPLLNVTKPSNSVPANSLNVNNESSNSSILCPHTNDIFMENTEPINTNPSRNSMKDENVVKTKGHEPSSLANGMDKNSFQAQRSFKENFPNSHVNYPDTKYGAAKPKEKRSSCLPVLMNTESLVDQLKKELNDDQSDQNIYFSSQEDSSEDVGVRSNHDVHPFSPNMKESPAKSDVTGNIQTPGTSGILSRVDALRKSGDLGWKRKVDKHALNLPVGNNSISQRVEALKRNGEDWRRMDDMKNKNEILTGSHENLSSDKSLERKRRTRSQRPSSLKERISYIQSHENDWKKRVEVKDVTNFTVAGKMEKAGCMASPQVEGKIEHRSSFKDRSKKVPPLKIIKSSEVQQICESESSKTKSTPDTPTPESVILQEIEIPKVDDESFNSFFKVEIPSESRLSQIDLDLDSIAFQSDKLLSSKKCIKIQQRRTATSKNPLKALAARPDIRSSYIETRPSEPTIPIPVPKQDDIEKPVFTIEDIKQQGEKIRSTGTQCSVRNNGFLPYKDLMLIQVKGRRHVQVRLVEPSIQSINSGDVYILVTPKKLFYWIGKFSNVQEQNKGLQIVKDIVKHRDLGVSVDDFIKLEEVCFSRHMSTFWQLLGGNDLSKASEAAAPEEDEEYELSATETNMMYELKDGTLVPVEKYWGHIPRIGMLDEKKALVLDFGSELYVWVGRRASNSSRKICLILARELWEQEFDYTACDFNPMNCCAQSQLYSKKGVKRPEWTLLAKISSNMETILFKEKFDDWPHSGRMPVDSGKSKRDKEYKDVDINMDLVPYDARLMLENSRINSLTNLRLDASTCVGRGVCYYDDEFRRYHEVETLDVTVLTLKDKELVAVSQDEFGQFYMKDSYVVKWSLQINQRARTLQGGVSSRYSVGKMYCCYFLWHGSHASDSIRGMTAKALADTDTQHHRQLLIEQGEEPPAFLNMFSGRMTIRYGALGAKEKTDVMMFRVTGLHVNEACLTQVSSLEKHLRSKTSYVVVDMGHKMMYIWQGIVATDSTKELARKAANKLVRSLKLELKVIEMLEGEETSSFWSCLRSDGKRKEYHCLLGTNITLIATPRLFHLTAITGKLESEEVLCSHDDASQILAFPFSQDTLYSASQPALFLLDNHSELWIWQGVYVQSSESYHDQSDLQRRWDALRRVGLATALSYARVKDSENPPDATVVTAGSEPIEFTNLFPEWEENYLPEDCKTPNLNDTEVTSAGEVLSQLTCGHYSMDELTNRPLPEGVVPTMLEKYLTDEDFLKTFGMNKEAFYELPYWKQMNKKKEVGLFV